MSCSFRSDLKAAHTNPFVHACLCTGWQSHCGEFPALRLHFRDHHVRQKLVAVVNLQCLSSRVMAPLNFPLNFPYARVGLS